MAKVGFALKSELKNATLIVLGVLICGLGLKGFLLSGNFIDGGVTGISMLVAKATGLPLFVYIPLINLPFIWLGLRQVGPAFAMRSALAIGGLSATIALVPYPHVTQDLLLTAVFGGLFIGAGIGLAMRGGAVLDGTEIAAILISRQSPLLQVGDVILIMNVFIFGAAAFLLGIEAAMYSLLTYVAAGKTIDFLVHGIEEYTAIIIISEHHERIRRMLTADLGKGVTLLKAGGGFGKRPNRDGEDFHVLYCVVTRLEIGEVRGRITQIDANAFVIQHSLGDAQGGMVRRRALN